MPKLSLDFQVPDKYDKQTIAGIIRAICTQINQVSEGGISGRYQAQSAIPSGSAVSYATGDMVWDANVTVTSGRLGWVCTVPGSPGTLLEFGGLMTTPPVDTNSSQFATTAFVLGQAGNGTPLADGTAVSGTSTRFSRQDHVHPSSPSLAGNATPLMDGSASAGVSASFSRQDHVHPVDTSRMPLTPSFESAEQGIVASTLVTVAHSLGRVPKLFRVVIRCKTGEFGFSAGDEVDVTGGAIDSGNNPASGSAADSTNVYIGTSSSQPVVLNRTTLARVAVTTANWKYVAYAW